MCVRPRPDDQEEIAARLGVARNTVSDWLTTNVGSDKGNKAKDNRVKVLKDERPAGSHTITPSLGRLNRRRERRRANKRRYERRAAAGLSQYGRPDLSVKPLRPGWRRPLAVLIIRRLGGGLLGPG
jgi:hypothetical protein